MLSPPLRRKIHPQFPAEEIKRNEMEDDRWRPGRQREPVRPELCIQFSVRGRLLDLRPLQQMLQAAVFRAGKLYELPVPARTSVRDPTDHLPQVLQVSWWPTPAV